MNWARAHWLVGVLALIVFPLTGQYMLHAADVPHLDSVPRLVFRSRHLLLLVAAVVNLALSNAQPFHRAQKAASLLVMLSPALLSLKPTCKSGVPFVLLPSAHTSRNPRGGIV